MPGGVAPKFGAEKSRYTGVSQLQLRVSRYTVQLSIRGVALSPLIEGLAGVKKHDKTRDVSFLLTVEVFLLKIYRACHNPEPRSEV